MDAPADPSSRVERRRTPRYDAGVLGPISVRLLGGPEVQLVNFSEGGLLFQSETRLLVGARATVKIVRGSETVIAAGTVVRSLVQGMVSGTLQFQTGVSLAAPLPLAAAATAASAGTGAAAAGMPDTASIPLSEGPASEEPSALTPLSVCFVSLSDTRADAIRRRLAAHADVRLDVTVSADAADVVRTSAGRELILVDGTLDVAALGELLGGLRATPLGASIAILAPEHAALPAEVTALANACVADDQPDDALAEGLRDAAWTPWQPVSTGTAEVEGLLDGLFGARGGAAAPRSVLPVPDHPIDALHVPDERAALVSERAALRQRVSMLERDLEGACDRLLEAGAEAAALEERQAAAAATVRALASERDAAVARALQLMRERDDLLDGLNTERQRVDALARQMAAAAPAEAPAPGGRSRKILGDETSDLPVARLQRLLAEARAALQHERELRKELETQLDENAEALERTVQAYEARLDLSSR